MADGTTRLRAAGGEAEADRDGLHVDEGILTIVFPEVRPGSITESIIVEERYAPIIPNHHFSGFILRSPGPARKRRIVLELPTEMESTFVWKTIGASLPPPRRQEVDNQLVRFTWESGAIPPWDYEPGGAPPSQIGPMLRFATTRNWETIGQWYSDLLNEHQEAPDKVRQISEEWAGDAREPRAIAEALFRRVSNDVRYVGLEFGDGAFQPRPPLTVHQTRYGDCKDKANLLRVLLREKGITSRMALLQTSHAGVIAHAVPHLSAFNHAILAVDLPGESGPVFCDPTIEGMPFGMLAPQDGNREALLIAADGGIEWARTPSAPFGALDASLKLTPEPGGGFSGWLNLKTEGYNGYALQRFLKGQAQGTRLNNIGSQGLLHSMPDVSAIDYTGGEEQFATMQPFQSKIYLCKPGAGEGASETTEKLAFPHLGYLPLIPEGAPASRSTAIMVRVATTRVSCRYTLPEGWKVLDLPGAIAVHSRSFHGTGSWRQEGAAIVGDYESRFTKDQIPPDEYADYRTAALEFTNWLKNPALVKPAKDSKPEEDAQATFPPFPKMPTLEGQSRLLEKRFPFDMSNPFEGDHSNRRKA